MYRLDFIARLGEQRAALGRPELQHNRSGSRMRQGVAVYRNSDICSFKRGRAQMAEERTEDQVTRPPTSAYSGVGV